MALTMKDTAWKFADTREWREHYRSWPPVIITCAITGGMQGKDANPNLPTSPEEQADSAYDAYKAGAASIHIHARDPRTNYVGAFSARAEDFYRSNHTIRERCPDVVICDTGSTAFSYSEPDMMKFWKEIDSELSSIDVGVICMVISMRATPDKVEGLKKQWEALGSEVTYNPETGKIIAEATMKVGFGRCEMVLRAMKAANTKPEFEVFSPSSFWFVDHSLRTGLAAEPYWCQLVFGQEGACSLPSPISAIDMFKDLPPKSLFSAIGIGPLQLPIITQSLILGGHVRVGMEDNVYYRHGELAKSNGQLVERAARICHELNREVATPAQAREMLGLSATPKQYP